MAFSKLMIFDSHVLGMFAHSIIQIKTVLFNISDCFSGPILKIICWGDICITRLPQCLISSLGIMLKHWNVGPALGQHEINITWASMGHYWASGQTSSGPISKCQYWPNFSTYIGPIMGQCTYVTWVWSHCEMISNYLYNSLRWFLNYYQVKNTICPLFCILWS